MVGPYRSVAAACGGSVCVPAIVQLPVPEVNVNPVGIAPVVTANDVASVADKVIVLTTEAPV